MRVCDDAQPDGDTLAKDADLMTTLTALTACGYSKTDAIKAMARAAEGGAVTRAEIIPN